MEPNERLSVPDELEQRIDRARTLDADVHQVDDDPIILELDSESGETYTIVPNTAYCGCPDSRYRGQVCKHLIHCLVDPDDTVPSDARATLRDAVHFKAREATDRTEELVQQASDARDEAVAWATVASFGFDDSSVIERFVEDGEELSVTDDRPSEGTVGDLMADQAESPGPLPGILSDASDVSVETND